MGRHFEVRAASMAASAARKSAVYMRASKEIYMAAKSGVPDPANNLALRSAIEKYRKSCPKDVIDRAVKKAAGGDATNYIAGQYEAFGPYGTLLVIDTLTDNVNRALTDVRTAITRKGGHLGSVAYNFSMMGIIDFAGDEAKRDEVEEALILGDVDVQEVSYQDGYIEVLTSPETFEAAKKVLNDLGISDFENAETTLLANEKITLEGDELTKFKELLDTLDEVGDVQAVYHNVDL